MKIAFAGPFPPFRGGIAQFTARLFGTVKAEFPQHTFHPVSFSRLYPSMLFPGTTQMEPDGSTVKFDAARLLDSCNPVRWSLARSYFRKEEFDGVICQYWHPFFVPCLLGSIPGDLMSAAVCHNALPHESFPLGGELARRFFRRTDCLVTHSGTDFQEIASVCGDPSRVLRLYLPLFDQYRRDDMDRDRARSKLGFDDETRLVLFFGLVRPYKGLVDLVRAMRHLPEDVALMIVGECYMDRTEIQSAIDEEDLSHRISWRDEFVPDDSVSEYFQAADVVALPYRHATQSAVAQIALSFNRVLVLTDTGGLSELVDPGETGFLAESGSPESIAMAIASGLDLSARPETIEKVGRKALEFQWSEYAHRLMKRFI